MFTNPEQNQEAMDYLKRELGYTPFSSWKLKDNVFKVDAFYEGGCGVFKVFFDPNELATVIKVKRVG